MRRLQWCVRGGGGGGEGWTVRGGGVVCMCVQVGRVVGIINSVCILIFIV